MMTGVFNVIVNIFLNLPKLSFKIRNNVFGLLQFFTYSPCIMCVQYIGGCSVHRGVFSTSGGYHEYVQYIGGDTMSTSGDVHMFSTSGDTMSTSGDIMSTSGEYHEYIGGCSVHRGMFSTSGDVQYIGGCSVHQSFQ